MLQGDGRVCAEGARRLQIDTFEFLGGEARQDVNDYLATIRKPVNAAPLAITLLLPGLLVSHQGWM